MQVDLLTVNLVNFEMGLFLVGILLGSWSFSMLMLPLLFGFSYCVYPVPPVESLPFESLRALSSSNEQVERQNTPCVSPGPN